MENNASLKTNNLGTYFGRGEQERFEASEQASYKKGGIWAEF